VCRILPRRRLEDDDIVHLFGDKPLPLDRLVVGGWPWQDDENEIEKCGVGLIYGEEWPGAFVPFREWGIFPGTWPRAGVAACQGRGEGDGCDGGGLSDGAQWRTVSRSQRFGRKKKKSRDTGRRIKSLALMCPFSSLRIDWNVSTGKFCRVGVTLTPFLSNA
jgi:hypothetical protein